jgi:uncharacterized protein (DUF58 family)
VPDSTTGAGGPTSVTVAVPAHGVWLPVPTRSAALLVLIAAILELLGRLIDSTGVTVAAAAALGAVVSDAALTPRIAGIRVRRDLATRLTAGLGTTVRLTMSAPTGRRGGRRPVTVRYDSPALPPVLVVTPTLRAGHEAVAQPTATPQHRGRWDEDGLFTVAAYSPLGGFVRRHSIPVSGAVWVHPAPAPPLLLPEADSGRGAGSSQSPRSGSGTEFFGIREWRSGDTPSAIHWRASARRSQLIVMERERPVHSALLVVAAPIKEPDEKWERAIARTAAAAVIALRSGRTVVTVCASTWSSPRDAHDLLDWFAALAPNAPPDPATLSAALRAGGRGCAVVWLAGYALPADVVAAGKAAGVGSFTSAAALIEPAHR